MDCAVAHLVHTDEGFPNTKKLSPENQRHRAAKIRRLRSIARGPVKVPRMRAVEYRGKLAIELVNADASRRRIASPFLLSERAAVTAQLASATHLYEWSPVATSEVRAILNRRMLFARSRATARGRACTLELDALCALYDRQGGLCAVTGLMLDIGPSAGDEEKWRRPFRPSLDRIDSRGGYTPENVRLVCAAMNNALGPWGEAVFAVMAQAFMTRDRHVGSLSSAVERRVHIADVVGSIPTATTTPSPA